MITVSEIKRGDAFTADGFLHWVAIGNARQVGRLTEVSVIYGDGGLGLRQWDDPSIAIAVQPATGRALELLEAAS
jgi:hypothetical protein